MDSCLHHDTVALGDFPLCRLLLSKDANYPWFILVPRRRAISEVFQLEEKEQKQLWEETTLLAKLLDKLFVADKMNIATLGNVVRQLHMHVIVRRESDAAWPGPVWGSQPALAYAPEELAHVRRVVERELGNHLQPIEA
nr:HIT domain-containing protein [Pseudomonas aegrilactucae]